MWDQYNVRSTLSTAKPVCYVNTASRSSKYLHPGWTGLKTCFQCLKLRPLLKNTCLNEDQAWESHLVHMWSRSSCQCCWIMHRAHVGMDIFACPNQEPNPSLSTPLVPVLSVEWKSSVLLQSALLSPLRSSHQGALSATFNSLLFSRIMWEWETHHRAGPKKKRPFSSRWVKET